MKRLLFVVMMILITHAVIRVDAEGLTIETVREEFLVNTNVISNQDHATVSIDKNRKIMMVWNSYGVPGSNGSHIIGRLFDEIGNPFTGEILISGTSRGYNKAPDISTNGNGKFVVTWCGGIEKKGYDIFAKVLSSDGNVIVPEIKINNNKSIRTMWPDVSMYDNGDFLVIWDETDIDGFQNVYVRLFDANGNSLREPLKLNSTPSMYSYSEGTSRYQLPDIDVKESGDAVAVWQNNIGSATTLYGRWINPYTGQEGQELLMNKFPGDVYQQRPGIDYNNSGDILVRWYEQSQVNPGDVYLRKYYASTSTWGHRIIPHDSLDGRQDRSVAQLTENGHFVVAWSGYDPAYQDEVYMRFYNSKGVPISEEITVNTNRANAQRRPALDFIEETDSLLIIITWESYAQDGDAYGVFGKIYRVWR